MKRTNVFYWIFTGLLLPLLGYGSVLEVTGNPNAVQVTTSLGYPAYLSTFLGIARILALLSLFTPNFHRLKEWAYAGLVFDITGAIYSLLASGRPIINTIFPAIVLGIVLGSYILYHKGRNSRYKAP